MPTAKSVQRVVVAVAVLCLPLCFAIPIPLFGQGADSSSTKLRSLLEQRRDVLKTRVEILDALFTSSRGSREAVTTARNDLLDAEYELATKKTQRIEVLQKKLENAKEYELLMEQRKKDARATQADVLMATALRLGIEVKLLREQE
jgi:hypothetical protein